MREILHNRLPQRLAHRVPPLIVESLIGLAAAIAMVLLRMPIAEIGNARAPFALVFVAIVIAALVGGWRSGLVALVAGQLLTWYVIVAPANSFALTDSGAADNLIVATMSQLLVLLVVSLYQREIDRNAESREKRLRLLDDALREIDHRTRNNFQVVQALIHLQASRAADAKVRVALEQVSDRIEAVAGASRMLALNSSDIAAVRLDDHLAGLCDQVRRGLTGEDIDIRCDVEPITVDAETATAISIIVNELLTNAIKHAFVDGGGGMVRVTGRRGTPFELVVEDNGGGIAATPRSRRGGLGTQLVESFVRQLGAVHETLSSSGGTCHRLLLPGLREKSGRD